jgi:glycosyltransferase involved in cell wall biosynthesis
MRIGVFRTADPLYGGTRYESMVAKALTSEHTVTLCDARPWLPTGHRLQSFARPALAERRASVDLWIRNDVALTYMTRKGNSRQVGIIHHVRDPLQQARIWNRCLDRRLLPNARRCERVVVVSRYWQDYLSDLGIRNAEVIYNAFDTEKFAVSDDEVRAFRERHGLVGKPVVYIGNCQQKKGAPAVWRALRPHGYHLVTSGFSDVTLPVQTFLLPYDKYILLLAACDVVVTMSEFNEGWNRTAHEALLCGTPVIGSGTGGMGELLKGGCQLVCQQVADLPQMIQLAIARRRELGTQGHGFATQFTVDRFNRQWLGLIASL